VPAAHDEIRWPFAFRLAFDERVPTVIAANPTTYARPASRNTVGVIVHGGAVYAANCASCHGADGRGTASGAPALAAEHVLAHRAGDLYWWITHGIERTAMPAFGDRISERERWDVVHYVVALAAASALPDDGHAPYAIAAPEFAFQIDRRPQQSVAANAPAATLLVLYTLPESHERLLEIATELPDLARAGIRVAAVPMRAGEAPADDPRVQNIVALGSRGLVDAYRVFAADAAHVEVLIDREGLLRARWRSAFVPPAQIAREYASLPAAKAAAAHDHGH
jgi:mono/diheme cytochrome c family protein